VVALSEIWKIRWSLWLKILKPWVHYAYPVASNRCFWLRGTHCAHIGDRKIIKTSYRKPRAPQEAQINLSWCANFLQKNATGNGHAAQLFPLVQQETSRSRRYGWSSEKKLVLGVNYTKRKPKNWRCNARQSWKKKSIPSLTSGMLNWVSWWKPSEALRYAKVLWRRFSRTACFF